MSKMDEIYALQEKMKTIVKMEDRDERARAGKWLENECRNLDDRYKILDGLDDVAIVELRAIVQIIFDYILFDDLQDKDWQGALPTHYDGDIASVMKTLKQAQGSDHAS